MPVTVNECLLQLMSAITADDSCSQNVAIWGKTSSTHGLTN